MLGRRVLVGPASSLAGCRVEEDVFLATGSRVFNGARIGSRSEVRINGIVHPRTVLPADSVVPIRWVAVGDPVRILPADEHDGIWAVRKGPGLPGHVFGLDRPAAGESLMPPSPNASAALSAATPATDRSESRPSRFRAYPPEARVGPAGTHRREAAPPPALTPGHDRG
ncbi:hypothetical protein ACFZCF_18315 [Streptomyces sp. NPDC007945]|uniref:hypothetical protein n=1 Tax=Streptomyces sp. NPDC007945 TaxID=3364797 RepID=UPI0036E85CB7